MFFLWLICLIRCHCMLDTVFKVYICNLSPYKDIFFKEEFWFASGKDINNYSSEDSENSELSNNYCKGSPILNLLFGICSKRCTNLSPVALNTSCHFHTCYMLESLKCSAQLLSFLVAFSGIIFKIYPWRVGKDIGVGKHYTHLLPWLH